MDKLKSGECDPLAMLGEAEIYINFQKYDEARAILVAALERSPAHSVAVALMRRVENESLGKMMKQPGATQGFVPSVIMCVTSDSSGDSASTCDSTSSSDCSSD